MNERVIHPEGRGFLMSAAHPAGCSAVVDELAAEAAAAPGPRPAQAGPVALVIGSSAGYGLAATVTGLVQHGIRGIGICAERAATGRRTATAGWYRAVRTARLADELGRDFTLINGDCFREETKEQTVRLLAQRYGPVDHLIYAVAAPRRTDPCTGTAYQSVIKPLGSAFRAQTLTFTADGQPSLADSSVEPATSEECAATVAVMGGADWARWVQALTRSRLLGPRFRTVALSYVGPEATAAIYRRGTIGAAKEHLEHTARVMARELPRESAGLAFTSVNGVAATQASMAIPGVPLYIALLRRALGDRLQSPATQLTRLWEQLTGGHPLGLDEAGRVRLDDWELRPEVQDEVRRLRGLLGTGPLTDFADAGWLLRQVRRLYGFDVDGVDYAAPVETDLAWPVRDGAQA